MKYIIFGNNGEPWSGGPYSVPSPNHISVTYEQARRAPEMERLLIKAEEALALAESGFTKQDTKLITDVHLEVRAALQPVYQENRRQVGRHR